MTIECYEKDCRYHCCNNPFDYDGGPYCYEIECRWEEHLKLKLEEIEAILKSYNTYHTCPNCGTTFKD